MNTLKHICGGVFLLWCLCAAGGGPHAAWAAGQDQAVPVPDAHQAGHQPSDNVVTVNGMALTHGDIEDLMQSQLGAFQSRLDPDRLGQMQQRLRQKIIDDFITRTLLTQEADKRAVTVSPDEVDAAIKEMEKNLPAGMTFEAALQTMGVSPEKMRADLAFGLRAKKLIDTQLPAVPSPAPEEIRAYYNSNKETFVEPEKVHARHILIKTDPKDDARTKTEKKDRTEALRAQLIAGAEFGGVAREHSECPSREKGGDLGTFSRGRMVREFEEAAFNQKKDEIGPVVETKFGYHIIQVLEHSPATPKSFADVQDSIAAKLQNQKKNEAIQEYLSSLRQKAVIEYEPDKKNKP